VTVQASTGLPAVNQALEPAWVRHGSATTQKTYETALAFEGMLVQQLSRSLTATSGLGGEGEGEAGSEEGGSPSMGASELSSLLPQALSDGVMSAGGLGLAAQLTRDLQDAQGASPAQASGGTAPSAASGATPAVVGGVGT
jgi:Rod binding domain-containing protein